MKKYPVISERGNVYEACISEDVLIGRTYLLCELFCEGNSVYEHADPFLEYKDDYIGFVKDAVSRHEKAQVERALKVKRQAETLRKFEEWDGDCR